MAVDPLNAKVAARVEHWPDGILASFTRIVKLMQVQGPDIGMPHTRAMGGGLFEVRAKGREGIGRAFYCTVAGERIVILHAIIKKTEKPGARFGDSTRKTERGKDMTRERYEPVPFDVAASHARWMKREGYAAAYDALADEFAALAELVRARQHAAMTQADVAERMGIAQATVARLESSAGSRKHAPSMATLRRYADAVGCELRITLAPARKSSARRTNAR